MRGKNFGKSDKSNKKGFSKNKPGKGNFKSKKTSEKDSRDNRDNSKPTFKERRPKKLTPKPIKATDGSMRLNKFIANAGICSRREADHLIQAGAVEVNGKVVSELGTKVGPDDIVHYGGDKLSREKSVYILLNKPKDFITTADDPQKRRTVLQLVNTACKERVFPVGRLDRNTTGVLLLTNDGDLTKKLTHPKHDIKKIYQVTLDKNLTAIDLAKIKDGLHLPDGFMKVDDISYVDGQKKEIGVQIHSGKNRIVRRIFEHLDYEVTKLDRVYFAGLTKKRVPRGKWRFLEESEVQLLKMLS